MKATFEFKLPDEEQEYFKFSRAEDLFNAAYSFDRYLRDTIKYNPDDLHSSELDLLQKVRDKFHEILQEHEYSLLEII